MSKYTASIYWERDAKEVFVDRKYSRVHRWQFDGGTQVAASASPSIVPLPYSNECNVDPEEAFVASLSSCHMLFFLDLAAQRKWTVESYTDNAYGILELNEKRKKSMTKVVLNPRVVWTGKGASDDELEALHHEAHALCYIANSVMTDIEICAVKV